MTKDHALRSSLQVTTLMRQIHIKLVIICLIHCAGGYDCPVQSGDFTLSVSQVCDCDCPPENCQGYVDMCNTCGVDSEGEYVIPSSENGEGCAGCSRVRRVPFCKDPSKDSCNYKAYEMCGETCQHSLDDCSCGGETFNIRTSQEFCCNGTKQKFNEPCQGLNGPACYNSYQDSQFLGYNGHFSCPDSCVPLLDMCQGISFCEEDVKVCNENLKVPSSIQFKAGNTFYGKPIEKKNLTSSPVPEHHYYIQNAVGKQNNGQYDIIDRSDENLNDTKVEIVDYSKLQFCTDSQGNPGVQCNGNDSVCIPRNEWCNDSPKECGSITTGNDIVCSNHTFWEGATCNINDPDAETWETPFKNFNFEGEVCPQRPGQCYYPWYRRSDANIKSISIGRELKILSRTCTDKSDQVFKQNQSCPNRTQYHEMGMSIFCRGCDENGLCFTKNRPLEICQDSIDFPNNTIDWIDDPSNCWGSCAVPGENCLACSNNDYFQCPRSQVRKNNIYYLYLDFKY